MRKKYFFNSVIFFMFFSICSWAQKTPDLNKIPSKYIDPNFPKYIDSGNKMIDLNVFDHAKKDYFKKHKQFPDYINTGNIKEDSTDFEKAKEEWFLNNPYYPVYIETGNVQADKENFERAKAEWINKFPKQYKEITNEIYAKAQQSEVTTTVEQANTIFVDYPVMKHTGNEFQDIEEYHIAINEWFKNHPEVQKEIEKEDITEEHQPSTMTKVVPKN